MGLITDPFVLVKGETAAKAVEMLTDVGVTFNDVRIVQPRMCYTLEFRPDRLNLTLDENNLVTEASMG